MFRDLLKIPTPLEAENYFKENLKLSKKVYEEFRLPFLRRLFNPSEYAFGKKFINDWNKSIDQLAKKEKVLSSLENLFQLNVSIASFKLFLLQLVLNLNENHPYIEESDIAKLAEELLFEDDKVKLMTGLSCLEICILIAIKHHCEIYDNDPFNFEMILTRYNKFAYKSSAMQNIDRDVVLKGFENLKVSFFKVTRDRN